MRCPLRVAKLSLVQNLIEALRNELLASVWWHEMTAVRVLGPMRRGDVLR